MMRLNITFENLSADEAIAVLGSMATLGRKPVDLGASSEVELPGSPKADSRGVMRKGRKAEKLREIEAREKLAAAVAPVEAPVETLVEAKAEEPVKVADVASTDLKAKAAEVLTTFLGKKGIPAAMEVLHSFQAGRLSDVDTGRLPEFIAALEKGMA